MDGEHNGSKPYYFMDDWWVKPTIFGNIQLGSDLGSASDPKDVIMYRGELAKCADLLAFQLGKADPVVIPSV